MIYTEDGAPRVVSYGKLERLLRQMQARISEGEIQEGDEEE